MIEQIKDQQTFDKALEQLSPRRLQVLQKMIRGESDKDIADSLGIHKGTVRKQISSICNLFGLNGSSGHAKRTELMSLFFNYGQDLIDKPIGRVSVQADHEIKKAKEIFQNQTIRTSTKDLKEAPSFFFGRKQELEELKKWILQDKCRLVVIEGQGGMGKTTLSVKLTHEVKENFDYIIWHDLNNAPPLKKILEDSIKIFPDDKKTDFGDSVEELIKRLIDHLSYSRCLLILDNVESILSEDYCFSGDSSKRYIQDYEKYGYFLTQVMKEFHQSCLLLTSREKLQEIAMEEGAHLPVRSFPLKGLDDDEAIKILKSSNLSGSKDDKLQLANYYSCNPLALKIVSNYIQDLFEGKISKFLLQVKQSQSLAVVRGIEKLLDKQFKRLSPIQQKIMYWLAINREPISAMELREDLIQKLTFSELSRDIEILKWKSLIEPVDGGLTLQPVIMEYVISRLIKKVGDEINTGQFEFFNEYCLIKATAKDYIKNSQTELILKPIAGRITYVKKQLIDFLKKQKESIKGYAAGNILNLLCHFKESLVNADFSNLTIWQAYLRGVDLQGVNFSNSDLSKSRFTEVFGSILSVASHPNKNILAVGDTKNKIRLLNLDNQQFLLVCEGHSNWVRSVTFNPNGKMLASASDDKTVRLWDTETAICLQIFGGHTGRIWSVVFSPNGETLASCSEDQTIKLWNIKTGECIHTLKQHDGAVHSIAFSHNGKILVSSSEDSTIKLWDIETGECTRTLDQHDGAVRSVVFSPDGKTLASGSQDSIIKLWDIETGECARTLDQHDGAIRSIAFSHDGKILASSSEDKTIKLWNVETSYKFIEELKGHTAKVWSIAFSYDDQMLISSSDNKIVKLWQVTTGKCLKTLEGYDNWAWALAFSPNNCQIVSSHEDQTIKLWDTEKTENHLKKSLNRYATRVRAIAFSSDEKTIASGSDDQKVMLWDVNTNQLLKILPGHIDRVLTVAFSPDGKILASGGDDKVIRLWDVRTGKLHKKLKGHKSWIWSVAFSPNGKTLASGSEDQTVKIWDLKKGEDLCTLDEHNDWVRSVAFSPDGKTLASGSEDQTVKIWNIADISNVKCIKTYEKFSSWIRSIDFTFVVGSNNQTLELVAIGGEEPTVQLWNTQTDEIQFLEGHQERIWSVVFSNDGKTLASSSEDGTIMLWNTETGEYIKTLKTPALYEGMNITGVKGLKEAEKNNLIALGAIDNIDINQ